MKDVLQLAAARFATNGDGDVAVIIAVELPACACEVLSTCAALTYLIVLDPRLYALTRAVKFVASSVLLITIQ